MKLKKTSILFILLPLCIFFTACSKENDNAPKQSENIIDFEQGNMNFTEGAGEQTFSFTTNTAWVVSVASTRNGGAPWCTVAPTSGNAGSHTIKVTTTPNETYDDRSVTVTLKAGTEVKSFVVSQKQKDAILLTNDKFEVDQEGGTVTVEVKSNVSYTATIGEECKDWIKESNSTRALSTTTKSYTVAMNEDGKKREGSIIFSDGSLTETVHIYQAGGSIILLSQNDCHVSASGEEITVELRSNCDYEVVMPSVDWIKETMTRGMSSHTLHYTVAPNDSYDGRKTEIIYRDKSDSSIADTLTILQAQKDAIIISEKEVKVGSEGGTVEVKIDANVDFEMQLPDVEWISETSTRGLSTHKKYLKIAENTGETSRTAEVVFKNTTSGIEETLTISQSAKGKRVKVHVEKPGTLSDYIAESEKLHIEELEVSGNLGGKDIAFIREMAGTYNHANTEGKLVYLNMTEANIVADGEYYLRTSSGKEYLPTENTIGEHMFSSRGLQTILLPKSVISIDDQAFSSCRSLNKVVIYENSVKTIGMVAFEYCSSLADIVLPEGVTTIGREAFRSCSSLSHIDLPEGVTTIGHGTFSGCEKLSNVTLPNSLTTIEDFAFSGCNGLTITIPDNVESMGILVFDGTGLDITIPGRFLTNMGNPIGLDCKDVRVTIAEGTTAIEEYAFRKLPGIVSVTIPESVTSIGHAAFWQCSGLTDIVIPSSVTEIGDDAFSECTNLANVTLPDGLTLIGEGVFADYSDRIRVDIAYRDLGVSPDQYKEVKSMVRKLISIPVEFDVKDPITGEESWSITGLFTKANIPKTPYSRGFSLEMDREVAKVFINVDRGFTRYIKEIALRAQSRYTIRMYMLISSWKEKGGFSIYVDRFRKFLKLEDKYPEFKDLYRRVIRPVYEDLFEQADCWFEMAEVYRNSGDTQPYKLNFKVIKSALSKKEEELLKGQKKMITNFCSLHFAMKDEHLQQFIPQITLNNYKAVVTKMLYLGEYVRDNWNKISNKAEYCLSVLLKEVEILPGMIGEEKEDE